MGVEDLASIEDVALPRMTSDIEESDGPTISTATSEAEPDGKVKFQGSTMKNRPNPIITQFPKKDARLRNIDERKPSTPGFIISRQKSPLPLREKDSLGIERTDHFLHEKLLRSSEFRGLMQNLEDANLKCVIDGLLEVRDRNSVEFIDWMRTVTRTNTQKIVNGLLDPIMTIFNQHTAHTETRTIQKATRMVKTHLKGELKDEFAEKNFNSLRDYWKDLMNLKDITRSYHPEKDDINITVAAHMPDVQFFEPLQHLPESAQDLCRNVVKDKLTGITTSVIEQYSKKLRNLENEFEARHNDTLIEMNENIFETCDTRVSELENERQQLRRDLDARDVLIQDLRRAAAENNANLERQMSKVAVFNTQLEAEKQMQEHLQKQITELEEAKAVLENEVILLKEKESWQQEQQEQKAARVEIVPEKPPEKKPEEKNQAFLELEENYRKLLESNENIKEEKILLQTTDKDLREAIAKQEIDLEKQRKRLQRQRAQIAELEQKKDFKPEATVIQPEPCPGGTVNSALEAEIETLKQTATKLQLQLDAKEMQLLSAQSTKKKYKHAKKMDVLPSESSESELSEEDTEDRFSEAAVFSRLYKDFVRRLEKMRFFRNEACEAREGILMRIYESQRKIVKFLQPDDVEEHTGWGDRGSVSIRGSNAKRREPAESYFSEFVTILKNSSQSRRPSRRLRQNSLPSILNSTA